MKFKSANFLAIIFVSAIFFFSAQQTMACSCMASAEPLKKQVTDARENAAAVFTAEVISVSEPSADQSEDRQVKLKVTKTYKGKVTGEITITTANNSAMCGYDFEAGKTYLIYAYKNGEDLSTTICSRTNDASTERAKQDIKLLKKIKKRD